MKKFPLTPIRIRNPPHSLHAARFSRSHLELRPWRPSPNDPEAGIMIYWR